MDIKIIPKKLSGTVDIVSSKSYAHRQIIGAMLSDKESVIKINGFSDDIMRTLSCAQSLGGSFTVEGNHVTVTPVKFGTENVVLDCGESGTTARIMLPVCAGVAKRATLSGRGRLPERPFSEMVRVLKEHGTSVSSETLPITVGGGLKGGRYEIEGNISSQYITGLMFALPLADCDSEIILKTPLASAAYVDMTIDVLKSFGIKITKTDKGFYVPSGKYKTPGEMVAEGDWSNAAFWIVAKYLGNSIQTEGLNYSSIQGDMAITELENKTIIDVGEIPDLFPILSVLAAGRCGETVLCNASRLRIKESDRIEATDCMLRALGCKTKQESDSLTIYGTGRLCGGTVDGFNDHRIVMSASIAATICENPVIIKGAEAVNKSYPTFFEDYKNTGGEIYVI